MSDETIVTGAPPRIQHVIIDGGSSGGGGGTQYTDGATQASPTGTVALGKDSSNVVHSLLTDASGALQVGVTGAGSGGTSSVDRAAYVAGTTAGTPLMVAHDDSTPGTLAEDKVGIARGSSLREVYTQIRDAAGNDRGVNVDASGNIGVTSANLDVALSTRLKPADTLTKVATVDTITNVVHIDDNSGSLTVDNGGTFAVQATEADGANTTLGAKADAKSTATDTTPISAISVLKQISASVQAPPSQAVTNAGTFATQLTGATNNINNIAGTITLPTGAATAAKQPALGTAGSASTDVISVQGITSMTPLKVDGSGATQPVSGTVTVTQGTAAAVSAGWPVIGGELADTTGTFTNATQTTSVTTGSFDGYSTIIVSINGTYGTATGVFEISDDAGTTWYSVNAARSDGSGIEIGYTTLTNTNRMWTLSVSGADEFRVRSTAVASGTVNVRVSVESMPTPEAASVSVYQPTGTNLHAVLDANSGVDIGKLTANQSVNLTQLVGTATDVNSGTKSAGTMRVVLATDQPALTNKLLVTPDSVALPANQSVNVSQINAVTPLMGNGVTGTGSQRVTIASDNTAFSVNIAADVPGTGATNSGKAEDAAHSSGDTGVMLLAVRNDTPGNAMTSTNGDYGAIAVDSAGRQSVQQKSDTATLTNVASSATTVTLLASNTARIAAQIYNDSTQICFVKFGTTASSTSFTIAVPSAGYYEVPGGYTGRIDGIWVSANGNARVTEIT